MNSSASDTSTPSFDYFIGLMSGTSLDGIDAALVKINRQPANSAPELISFLTHDMPDTLKHDLLQLNTQPTCSLQHFCQLEHGVAQSFIEATQALLKKANLTSSDICALGSHGQTIFHAVDVPMSLQIGHPAFIAKQTGITTCADFRVDDMANGGQGAPLAPAFHAFLLPNKNDNSAQALVNIGGIANISQLPSASSNTPVTGFDTGPGNALMDEWCQLHFNCDYDKNGDIAASASGLNPALLAKLLAHPYFNQPTPKSTGRDVFNMTWLRSVLSTLTDNLSPTVVLSTLCQLTVESIAQSFEQQMHSQEIPQTIFICGGGALNQTLLTRLQERMPSSFIKSTTAIGINPNAIEAMMCAWLAQQRIQKKPVSLSAITGSSKDSILGGLWLP